MSLFNIFALAGGLGLFLYGMDMMGKGLESAAGSKLKGVLEKLTSNRLMGVLVGMLVTAVIQSSSATTVMAVGFVNAGVMTLSQAFGVMLGANIGTTITGQIIAFNVSDYAPLFAILGILPMMFAKKRRMQSVGTIVAGFGILFIGLNMMGSAMEPLKSDPGFISFMTHFQNPLLGVLVGTIATGIIQSSSATVGILQTLAAQGLVSLDASLYIVLGCNIGTCVTAMLASIGTNTNARRTALMHLINKIIGAILFIGVLYIFPITDIVANLTPGVPKQQIANFHTIFNVLNTLILLPFGGTMVNLVTRLIKDRDTGGHGGKRLLYLDERILETPPFAMVQLQKEIGRMAQLAIENYRNSVEAFFQKSDDLVQAVFEQEGSINYVGREVTRYMVKIQGLQALPQSDKDKIFRLHDVVMGLERIGDHAENIAEFAQARMEQEVKMTPEALAELRQMCDIVGEALDKGLARVIDGEEHPENVALVEEIEGKADGMFQTMRDNHIARLNQENCTPMAGMLFTDMGIDLERISDYAMKIIRLVH